MVSSDPNNALIMTSLSPPSFAAVCATVLAVALPAQSDRIAIDYTPTCSQCTVALTRVVTLGRPTDPASPHSVPWLVGDSQGRFFAIADTHDQVLVYAPDGRLVGRVGRRGPGPGEFAPPRGPLRLAIGRGDTLYVLDRRFVSVFSPSLAFVRSTQLDRSATYAEVLGDGRAVLATRTVPRGASGASLQLIDRRGEIERPLGAESVLLPNEIEGMPDPYVVHPDGNAIWTSSSNYRLDEWRFDGQRGASLEMVNVPWFPKQPPPERKFRTQPAVRRTTDDLRASIAERQRGLDEEGTPSTPLSPPRTTIAGIDRAGLVWVVGTYPVAAERRMATVIDIIDPRARRLVASVPLTQWVRYLPGNELAYSVAEDANGLSEVTVWRVELRR